MAIFFGVINVDAWSSQRGNFMPDPSHTSMHPCELRSKQFALSALGPQHGKGSGRWLGKNENKHMVSQAWTGLRSRSSFV